MVARQGNTPNNSEFCLALAILEPLRYGDVGPAQTLMKTLARDPQAVGQGFHARFLGPQVIGHDGGLEIEVELPDRHLNLAGAEVDGTQKVARDETGGDALLSVRIR